MSAADFLRSADFRYVADNAEPVLIPQLLRLVDAEAESALRSSEALERLHLCFLIVELVIVLLFLRFLGSTLKAVANERTCAPAPALDFLMREPVRRSRAPGFS